MRRNYLSAKTITTTSLLIACLIFAACSAVPASIEAPQATPLASSAGSSKDAGHDAASDPFGFPRITMLDEPLNSPKGVPEELKTVWETWALLTRDHVDRSSFDPDKFTEEAIIGMIQAVEDPHTNYVSPSAFKIENDDLTGSFEGIGAHVQMRRDGKLLIVAPVKGGPADLAGIRPGDVVLKVDGETVEGMGLLEAVSLIRGPRGSTVALLILHLGAIDPVEVSVVRDVIPLTSVLLRSQPGEQIAHIRITSFLGDTAEKLAGTLGEVVDEGAEGIILDVRDNPGGLLSAVVGIADLFMDQGGILYQLDAQNQKTEYEARPGSLAPNIPVVLLANEFSASGSEILVGAFQDNGRAKVIGATTFGKGTVNIFRRLSNGGGLYIATARWYTPDGRPIEGEGLVPDIEIASRDPQKADTMQLEKAYEVLESEIHLWKHGG